MQSMKIRILAAAFSFLALAGCAEVDKEDTASSAPKSNVERTADGDSATGSFKADASGDQILVGAGDHHETSIEFAPGTLTIDQQITMQDGMTLGDGNTLPEELALGSAVILGGTTPLSIGSDQDADIGKPFTLALPLPLAQARELSSSSGKAFMTASAAKIALLYLVKTSTGNKIGLFVPGVDDLRGTIIRYKGARLGWIRLVVLSEKVESVEKDTTREPAAK